MSAAELADPGLYSWGSNWLGDLL